MFSFFSLNFCSWRWFYYTCIFAYGIWALWNKDWFWDIKYCWYHYPHHSVAKDIWWYYMVELSFYWALCISQVIMLREIKETKNAQPYFESVFVCVFTQFFDVKRKDFWEMFIHHITTIALMAFSWTCNLTRVGTLVLIIHDCADIFLEVGKRTSKSRLEN